MNEHTDSAALARLSRQIRHLRLGLLALASLMLAFVLVATTAPPADVIQARQFVVLGPHGEQFAILGEEDALFGKRYGLTLYAKPGMALASLSMSQMDPITEPADKPASPPPAPIAGLTFGSSYRRGLSLDMNGLELITPDERCAIKADADAVSLVMSSANKKPRLTLHNIGLLVQDGLDQERIRLWLNDTSCNLSLLDTKGQLRVGVGQVDEVGGGLVVYDAGGKGVWMAP